jgi:hypothetical protein
MNDVIAPKQSSLKSILVEATMFLKLNTSLIPNNLTNVAKSPIWNTLISSCLGLLDERLTIPMIVKTKMIMMILTTTMKMMSIESEEADYTC